MNSDKRWYQKQLRILQTVLREPDIVDYDANAVVSYMEDIRANCIVINGGGIVDFFRHDLETANPNPFMTNEDILKDLTEACHRRGLKVIVRVDFRGVDKRIYDLNPDWFALDERGKPFYWANSGESPYPLYTACYLSYYRNGHAFRMAEHLLKTYNVDGIWENSPFQLGACYCNVCVSRYREEKGKDIPRGGSFYDKTYDEYREWKADNLNRHLREFRETVKAFGEEKIYCAEIFGLFYNQYDSTSSDLYQVKDDFDFLVTPLFTGNHQPLNAPTTLIKFLQGLEPEKVPIMLFGHLGTNNELRYVASPDAETRIWMWHAVAAGGSLWNCIFNGHHPGDTFDRRNALLCKDVYEYMERHEERLHRQTPEADVAIFYSRASNKKFGNGDRSKDAYITNIIGMEQVLNELNLQYRFLLDMHMTEETLKDVRCLAIPNGACLSDEEIRLIRQYVNAGGRVIATGETSLYDADGQPRPDLGLGDVFGCSYAGVKKDGSHYGYQFIRGAHPLTAGFEDTELIANWGETLLVRATAAGDAADADAAAETPITFVPQIFPQSPERAWPKSFATDFPTCLVRRSGQGLAVYFPYGVDKQVWSHGHRDFRTVLGNAFRYLLDGEQNVRSDAPPSVRIMLNRVEGDASRYMLHLINTTSSPGRPVHHIVPVGGFEVELLLAGSGAAALEVLYGHPGARIARTEPADGGRRTKVVLSIEKLEEYAGLYLETTK